MHRLEGCDAMPSTKLTLVKRQDNCEPALYNLQAQSCTVHSRKRYQMCTPATDMCRDQHHWQVGICISSSRKETKRIVADQVHGYNVFCVLMQNIMPILELHALVDRKPNRGTISWTVWCINFTSRVLSKGADVPTNWLSVQTHISAQQPFKASIILR